MKFSIIITTLNEAETLEEFIRRIDLAFKKTSDDYELIFVDDSSHDGSQEIILNHRTNNPRIKLIEMSRQFGRHMCYYAGFKHATGDAAITMDSDLQDPPELIPELISLFKKEKADVVHTVMKKREGESKLKLILTAISYKILNRICSTPMPENAGLYKVMSKNIMDGIRQFEEADPYFKGIINWLGFKQVYYPFVREGRLSGKTKFSLLGPRPYVDFIKALTSFSYVPLYMPTIFLVASIPIVLTGSTTFTLTFLLLAILTSVATISLYLIQIHENNRKRPLYIIKQIIGF